MSNLIEEQKKLLEQFKNSDEPINKKSVIEIIEVNIKTMELNDNLINILDKITLIVSKYDLSEKDRKYLVELSLKLQESIE